MLFSIIIPIYNSEKFIASCIDSILTQTFTDFELILVDDGSTDKSGEICDEYAKKDSRIRVFHKENGGTASARNLGIEKAHGDYLHFVDADDFVLMGAYEYLDTVIHEYSHPDIICFKIRRDQVGVAELGDEEEHFYKDIHQGVRKESFLSTVWCKLFRREFVLKTGVRFYPVIYVEDVDFVWNIMRHEGSLLASSAVLYSYSTTPTGFVNNRAIEHVRKTVDSFLLLNTHLKEYSASYKDCPYAIGAFTHKYHVLFNRIISLPLKYEEINDIFHRCSAIGIRHLRATKWVRIYNFLYHHPLLYYMAQIPILRLYFWRHRFLSTGDFIDRRLKLKPIQRLSK